MRFYIVIPAHNEEDHLAGTLDSLAGQSVLPARVVVVNDNSTDGTQEIIYRYSDRYEFITGVRTQASTAHLPGSKVINAFYEGLAVLDDNYDILCKFDADLVFPSDYIESIAAVFRTSERIGMAGGHCTVLKNNAWMVEGLTSKDHIRGALKAYRKACFEQIGGLKRAMGWDTVDELLARYHGWEIHTVDSLLVKHLKPTGMGYARQAGKLQGAAFRNMRYGFFLTLLGAAKLSFRKGDLRYFFSCLSGYFGGRPEYLVSEAEGKFVRDYRWRNLRKRIF